MRRAVDDDDVTLRQRLCLTSCTLGTFDAGALNLEFCVNHHVTFVSIRASKISMERLKTAGLDIPALKRLGLCSIDLCDAAMARELVQTFGRAALTEHLVKTPSDAVAVVGSEFCDMVGLTSNDLLALCAGAPLQAIAILGALPHRLRGVGARVLLDCALNRALLLKSGFLESEIRVLPGESADFAKLGFQF